MVTLFDIQQKIRVIFWPFIGITILFYFLFHTLHGERGLMTWLALNQQIKESKIELSRVSSERSKLSNKINYLRLTSLDPDLLEERIRQVLNYGHENDVYIYLE